MCQDQAAELAERIRKGLDAEMKARESVFNMKILFKAAENAEMQKEMEKLKKEVDQQREKVNIMLYNVKSAEKVVRGQHGANLNACPVTHAVRTPVVQV